MDKFIDKSEIRRRRRRQYLRVGAVVAVAGLAVWGLSSLLGGKSVYGADLSSGTAGYGPLETSVAASGRIVPAYEEIIISPVSSRILEVYAHSGDTVSEGAPLLRLDLNEAEAQCQNLRDAYQIKANSLRQLRLANRTALSDLEMQGKIKQMEVNRMAIEVENERRLDSLGSGREATVCVRPRPPSPQAVSNSRVCADALSTSVCASKPSKRPPPSRWATAPATLP